MGARNNALGATHAGGGRSGALRSAFWFDYFKRTRSDGVCLSGAGAWRTTDRDSVPSSQRVLGDRDVLGELVRDAASWAWQC